MQLTFISDTHGKHAFLTLKGGDALIHCGDFSTMGELDEIEDFAIFMGKQKFQHKIVIAGNHDWSLEDDRRMEAETLFKENGVIYLHDSGIDINGYHFWGSPIQPVFCHWAFNRPRGEVLQEHWLKIPDYTDVLITHTPPYGILDVCYDGVHVGCEALLVAVERVKPRIHAFGHIHEGYNTLEQEGTLFINACSLNEDYQFKNPPIVAELTS
ncbi:metallophosphatase domain-containing protein [Thiofilum flexile]|uniref:metallophosphatase domain-containing protein n=1 Tax=Thiofilum flexile TaxID=125627 RepID=UPI0003648F5B|nr:metallophosphatase domain-containing protein [Thiofilum flexile]